VTSLRALILLDLKAIRVGKGAYRRLAMSESPRVQAAIASGRVVAVDARGRRLTPAQTERRNRRMGLARPVRVIGRAGDGSILPVWSGNSSRPHRSGDLMEAAMMGRSKKRRRRL